MHLCRLWLGIRQMRVPLIAPSLNRPQDRWSCSGTVAALTHGACTHTLCPASVWQGGGDPQSCVPGVRRESHASRAEKAHPTKFFLRQQHPSTSESAHLDWLPDEVPRFPAIKAPRSFSWEPIPAPSQNPSWQDSPNSPALS